MYIKPWCVVALALCTLARGLDFHSDEAAKCATEHWDEIRAIANPKISMMTKILPASGIERVKKLLGGHDELPKDPPPREWLGQAADVIPEGLLNMLGKDIINKCVEELDH